MNNTAVLQPPRAETFGPRPFARWDANPSVRLGQLGAEPPMDDLVNQLHQTVHGFADRVMRPIGRDLDRLSAEQVIATGSQLWSFRDAYASLGINMEALASFPPELMPDIFAILFEELGWGDAGLAISAGVDLMPHYMAAKFGNEFVFKAYPEELIGCWGITEPDHGSDSLDANGAIFHAQGKYGRPNCVAKITDGKVIISGQKSAWVSNGPIAELAILYCAAETKDGVDPRRGAVVIVPLKSLGVSKGKPLEKMGQRALPQGEIFFDNVELDIDHLLVAPEDYKKGVYAIHSEANALMGGVFTGCARAAYEHAYAYAHERKQGGVPIIRHQDVAKRLFHMARKVELSRAITRRVTTFNMTNDMPALQAAMFSKVTATQHALEVASDAVQMFGGNGVTCEYPVEKLFRDARSSLIEDGCNEILAIKGGTLMIDPDRLTPTA
ncbi:acyl-CoA dehydrogenase [Sphingopyxis sp. PAMC25046]|uniref:acyl-CoA dehydrogenase family protein n=1 Tax=Sphingopyxis sp. PAMC25046 TaxID=2565556 RepID=UPI00109D99FE|nr:acyl-CoA dehydrogenase family protein [Sphingopyxis sp. PAMC25046]QCB54700.1 acyl-CoA dehydrogenase [Sphingopyxis sp. PAMC25046]